MQLDLWKPLAGLMLFLLAMSLIEESVRALAGNRVKQVIGEHTRSRLGGILSGTLATALLQSSSLVGLLVLAFVGARVMPLKNALLIIFGANLGTTATGWIVATIGFKLDLEAASLPLMGIGGLLWITCGTQRAAWFGRLGLGIGLLLMALEFMKSALGGGGSVIDPQYLARFNVAEFLLFGVVFSAVVQSSSAVMVVTLSALSSGIIELPSAAALMIGADLGTTTTIILGAIRGSANKKRVALGHVLFNVGTDLLAFALLVPLVAIVSVMADPLMSLVLFHTLFNLLGVCLFTPFVSPFARLLEAVFVDSRHRETYLDPAAQLLPETAVSALVSEVSALADAIISQNASLYGREADGSLTSDFEMDYVVNKQNEGQILAYTLDLELQNYPPDLRREVEQILQIGRNLLLSAKLCKDSLANLAELAEVHRGLWLELMRVQRTFYQQFDEIGDDLSALQIQQIEAFAEMTNRHHDHLHQAIYAAIQADQLPVDNVSSVLNVNRSLYNSNVALLTAVAAFSRLPQGPRDVR
ncbi:MAG: Na/Pi symporter [Pseudomonadota bacterium]